MTTDSDMMPANSPVSGIAKPVILVVMGVSGSGKTTIAKLLAAALDCQFQEGDEFHPAANIQKMSSGTPLTDADRLPWLHSIAARIDDWRARGVSGVLTCSALKRAYRDIIIGTRKDVRLVYLKGSYDLIHQRMAARDKHFMRTEMLESQFATLQEPTPEERAITTDVKRHPDEIADDIIRQLRQLQG